MRLMFACNPQLIAYWNRNFFTASWNQSHQKEDFFIIWLEGFHEKKITRNKL